MSTGPDSQPPLKVDPELLGKYGGQLLAAAGDLPEAPGPFVVTGADAISQAIAEKLPGLEGPIQEALPQLKNEASTTASNVVDAAGRYSSTDAQLAANYEKHQFDSVNDSAGSGGSAAGGAAGSMGQLGQMMGMPMQMAGQAVQMPMQAISAVAQVPQGVMQGVQQIGQMAGGHGGGEGSSATSGEKAADAVERREDDAKAEQGAGAADAHSHRAAEPALTAAAPQPNSPRHATPDPAIDL